MVRRILIGAVRLYQRGLSPLTPGVCRFHPTCSQYAVEALERHGSLRGSVMALRRLLRCHPWGGRGYDPVPEPTGSSAEASVHGDSTTDDPPLGTPSGPVLPDPR